MESLPLKEEGERGKEQGRGTGEGGHGLSKGLEGRGFLVKKRQIGPKRS